LSKFLRGMAEISQWYNNAIDIFKDPYKWFSIASAVWLALGTGVAWLTIALCVPALDVSSAGGVMVGMTVVAEALLPLTLLQKAHDHVNLDLLGYTIPVKSLAIESEFTGTEHEEKWLPHLTFRRVNGVVSFWIAACAFVGTFTWAYSGYGFGISTFLLILIGLLTNYNN